MSFDLEELKIKLHTNIYNFFNYWKKFWFVISFSFTTLFYGFHLLLTNKNPGSGLTSIAITVAVLGWLMYARTADENLRRLKRVEFLSTAYEGIALYVRKDPSHTEYNACLDALEKSLAIIQLYGKRSEIKLVCVIIEQFNNSDDKNIQCDALLIMLRDGLRKELLLPKAVPYIRTIRFERKSATDFDNACNNSSLLLLKPQVASVQ